MAGDADEDLFRNEVLYLRHLFERRFDAGGCALSLINPPITYQASETAPMATYETLRSALDRLGQTLDPIEDVLFL